MNKTLITFLFFCVAILLAEGSARHHRNTPRPGPAAEDLSTQPGANYKIEILFLKYNVTSKSCQDAILNFYVHQNSNEVLDGDAPYPVMTASLLKNIGLKNNCSAGDLAAVASDYEIWTAIEDQQFKNEDPGVEGFNIDHEFF